jgi:hypothetical protein
MYNIYSHSILSEDYIAALFKFLAEVVVEKQVFKILSFRATAWKIHNFDDLFLHQYPSYNGNQCILRYIK